MKRELTLISDHVMDANVREIPLTNYQYLFLGYFENELEVIG